MRERKDDLSLLGVGLADQRKLEAMSLTTLEQIVLLVRYSLGITVSEGEEDGESFS